MENPLKGLRVPKEAKKPKRKPTPRQKATMMKIMRGVEPKKAALEAGYTELSNVVRAKGFEELLDEYLPEDKLLSLHRNGLDAVKYVGADLREVPDYQTQKNFLELAYKLRNRLKTDGGGNGDTINITLFSRDQLKRVAARIIEHDALPSAESSHRLHDSDQPSLPAELAP